MIIRIHKTFALWVIFGHILTALT